LKALEIQNDERLKIEAAQEDPARFAELYENNFERVCAYVARRVGNREDAQDVTVSKITVFKPTKAGRIPSFRVGTCVRFDPRSF
jgi:hypothetical protein